MHKSKQPSKGISIILTALLIVTLVTILALVKWERLLNISQSPITSSNTPEVRSFSLQIPQKALWKNYVTISAEVAPGTICDLLYIPPSGNTQELSSVGDENGKCSWRWKIEETDGKGNGRLIITIDGKSETHFIEIRSSF